ncbi:cell division control protein 48 homolog B isoform X2 [Nymphaea colorata]|uniref:cell division control protein 48 homolog B isoform X2 n=1 Tax=Nymphaea colorata TaxID=210225 RepID=UPI00129DCB63|nr:cell division control protein 48 homolog B isoform X2 [Nymphaea colorata]
MFTCGSELHGEADCCNKFDSDIDCIDQPKAVSLHNGVLLFLSSSSFFLFEEKIPEMLVLLLMLLLHLQFRCQQNICLMHSKNLYQDVLLKITYIRWRFVEIDADLSKLDSESKHVMSLISPANTYMNLQTGKMIDGGYEKWGIYILSESVGAKMEGSRGYLKEGFMAEEAVAGNSEALRVLRQLIIYPIIYAKESQKLGLKWPRGLLLYGPPGTGKTSLVRAVVRECGATLTLISPHTVHRAYAGESERILREAFDQASSQASEGKPSVIFIDEIDVLCPRRDSRKEQESRIVAQLLTLMDGSKASRKSYSHVAVIASTNRVNAIDPALRRPGRFDAEIEVTVPTEEERLKILELCTRKLSLEKDVDLQSIASSCNGFVGADIEALCHEAAIAAMRRCSCYSDQGDICRLTVNDWEYARSKVGPSITRGVTADVAKVSWEDIGGLKDLKKKLQQVVEWPIKHSDAFARLGLSPVRGVLLHGPPGCSKTTLVKAAAHAAQAAFFSLSGAEVYSMYVGEGEALLRRTFQRARLAAPSIIFFDEADSVASKRGDGENSQSKPTVGERLLSTLLTEMDGLESATGVLVLAATNRPHAIDAALMRPGRFDLVLYVPPPDMEARVEILQVHTRHMKLDKDVDLEQIAAETDLFTGAELAGLCREAGMVALREDLSASMVSNRHFQIARNSLTPLLTKDDLEKYSSFMRNHQ